MKRYTRNRLIGGLFAGALLSFGATGAYAQTTAGTTVGNTATITYKVGTVTQAPIESSPTGNSTPGAGKGESTDFKVDNKLALSVTLVDTAVVPVSPGMPWSVLTYKVTNDGNSTQGVSFTTVDEATGTASPFTSQPSDSFDLDTPKVFVSSNPTRSTYARNSDTAQGISQLAPGASRYVFVVSTTPLTTTDGDSAVVALVAQVAEAGADATYGTAPGADITTDDASAAWTPGTVQNIFADAAGTDDAQFDGKASARSAMLVKSAKLTITKTSSVVSDPVSTSGNAPTGYKPKALPGAVMQYTITVDNNADSGAEHTATDISVSDSLAAMTTGATNYLDDTGTSSSIKYTAPGGSAAACTASTTPVACTYASHKLTVSGITLDGGETATVTFDVTIK
ncbi:MAG TPA: hypothetical protein VFJ01_13140 [Oleiagrimonas sp.]|nr:hypothetical protein [Oleiagrimonas sp.]